MKLGALLAIVFSCTVVFGNTILVTPMKVIPKEVKSFANDLYAEVKAEKSLIQLFLDEGRPADVLSDREQEIDAAMSIQNPVEEHEDGSTTMGFLLHGCNGVFTDQKGVVYFWRLSSPRILSIVSQFKETKFLILEDERLDLLHGYNKPANKQPERNARATSSSTATPPPGVAHP